LSSQDILDKMDEIEGRKLAIKNLEKVIKELFPEK
jgi:hypothetical protein